MTLCQNEANAKQIKVLEILIYISEHIIVLTKLSIGLNKK